MSKKKIKSRIVSGLILVGLALGAVFMTACKGGSGSVAEADRHSDSSAVSDETNSAGSLSSVESAAAGSKDETVNIKADASGKVRSYTVSETLSDLKEGVMISDASTLSDINNPQGDEEFYDAADGGILWENHGRSITYEGSCDKELPVGVNITYYMDDKKLSPEDMLGKSGSFRIRFDYETDEKVPFMVLSLVPFDGEKFSDLETEGGKVASMGDDYFVIGYCLPHIGDQLGLADYKLTEELELKDYFEITGETTDFKLDYSASIFTNGLISEIEDDDIKDLEKLGDKGDDLQEAGDKLVDGADKLYDGAKDFGEYLDKYTDGVNKVAKASGDIKDGAESLASGLGTLSKNSSDLKKGAASLEKGLSSMEDALKDVDTDQISKALAGTGLESLGPLLAGLKESTTALHSGASSLSQGVSAYTGGVDKTAKGAKKLSKGLKEYAKGAKKLGDSGKSLSNGYDKLVSGISKYRDGVKKFNKKGLSKIAELTGDDFDRVITNLKKLRKADKEYKSFTGDLSAKEGSVKFIIETDGIK